MSLAAGLWDFSYKDLDIQMSVEDLDDYQLNLLQIRTKYKEKVSELTNCVFFEKSLPPEDNIFAAFPCDCKRHTHTPHCQGWYLLWNPNLELNKDKLKSSLHNHCASWQYKATSKHIQQELMKKFEKYFHYFDDDDTHEYYVDSYTEMKYGFKNEKDELPEEND